MESWFKASHDCNLYVIRGLFVFCIFFFDYSSSCCKWVIKLRLATQVLVMKLYISLFTCANYLCNKKAIVSEFPMLKYAVLSQFNE